MSFCAAPVTPTWLPQKQPLETLDWSLDIAQAISVPTDQIASVAVAAAPSGAGEIALTEIVALGDILTVTLAGGVAGRIYTLQFIVSMTDQRVFQFLAYIAVGQVFGRISNTARHVAGIRAADHMDIGVGNAGGGIDRGRICHRGRHQSGHSHASDGRHEHHQRQRRRDRRVLQPSELNSLWPDDGHQHHGL